MFKFAKVVFQDVRFCCFLCNYKKISKEIEGKPSYVTAASKPSRYPARKFCSICGYPWYSLFCTFTLGMWHYTSAYCADLSIVPMNARRVMRKRSVLLWYSIFVRNELFVINIVSYWTLLMYYSFVLFFEQYFIQNLIFCTHMSSQRRNSKGEGYRFDEDDRYSEVDRGNL